MFSKLNHSITPRKDREVKSLEKLSHFVTPKALRKSLGSFEEFVSPVSGINILTSASSPELELENVQHHQENEILNDTERKINLKIKNASGQKKRIKTWKNKSSQTALKERYMHETYAPQLLHCKRHQLYDSGKRKICNDKCCFNCQAKFTVEEIRQELQVWWGDSTDPNQRTTLLCEDLRRGHTVTADNTYQQQYIINAEISTLELEESTTSRFSVTNRT